MFLCPYFAGKTRMSPSLLPLNMDRVSKSIFVTNQFRATLDRLSFWDISFKLRMPRSWWKGRPAQALAPCIKGL